MNDIFDPYLKFSIVYINVVLVFSKLVTKHFSHSQRFFNILKQNRLVVSALKIKLCQTKTRFVGYNIYQGSITLNSWEIEFVDKFPNVIKNKNQLQRFLRCLNQGCQFRSISSGMTETFHTNSKNKTKRNNFHLISNLNPFQIFRLNFDCNVLVSFHVPF